MLKGHYRNYYLSNGVAGAFYGMLFCAPLWVGLVWWLSR